MKKTPEHISCRIVFMGTPDFAVASLIKLVESEYELVGVITAPDRPAGRGQKVRQSPVKLAATKLNIPVLQPDKLQNPEFLEKLRNLKADLFIVVAFRMLPQKVWDMPALGTFNLHASLLPQYRGAAPINWALINGEQETGITTFYLNQQIDTGSILLQKKTPVDDNMTAGELHDILMEMGSSLVLKTVEAIINETVAPIPQIQDSSINDINPAPKIFKEDCKIDWTRPASIIHNHIRGLSPYPAAWTHFFNENGDSFQVKLFKSEISVSSPRLDPGQLFINQNDELLIGTTTNNIKIISIKPEGKRQMRVQDFLRGFRGVLLKAK